MDKRVIEESMLVPGERGRMAAETSPALTHSPRRAQGCVKKSTRRDTKTWVRGVKTQNSPENAARERSRVRNLRQAFHSLQAALPSVPRDTKLSKLDVLVLATNYIAHLTETLDQAGTLNDLTLPQRAEGYLHPVKKWPMRSLLYCGSVGELLTGAQANQDDSRQLIPAPNISGE
ncbi:transcription factor 23 [Chanos chanos]|uniref:Transcription factor 23 n=1 Tax=Chanos chanos TaxID=29144 RepID=A0A6J2W0B1_CHACN|nr:transcription factor 23-like [Chanos chanos]